MRWGPSCGRAIPTAVAVILAASPVPGALQLPVDLVVALILGRACALVLLDVVEMWRRTAAGQALTRAIRLGEDPHGVIERVRVLELRGRPRLCRNMALRCLERAGRCRRVERGMRREAAMWVRRAREELGQWRGPTR